MIEIIENFLTDEESSTISSIDVTVYGKRVWEIGQDLDVKVIRSNIKPYIQDIIGKYNFPYSSAAELMKYRVGSCSLPHTDGSGSHYDSSGEHKIVTWTKTGVVLLNDDFEGGDLYFPCLNKRFGKEYKNCLVIFPAGTDSDLYTHGVSPITRGTRYTLIIRFID